MAKFENGFKGKPLWDEVNRSRIIEGDKVSFENLELSEAKEIIKSFVAFHKSIPDIEKNKIIVRSIFDAAKNGPLSDSSIEDAISKNEQEYLRGKLSKFRMHTSISIPPGINIRAIRFSNCFIKIGSKLDRTVARERVKVIEKGVHRGKSIPNMYAHVSIHISARSPMEAGEAALKTLNLVRGLFNLSLNRNQYMRSSSGHKSPVNQIQLGPDLPPHLWPSQMRVSVEV